MNRQARCGFNRAARCGPALVAALVLLMSGLAFGLQFRDTPDGISCSFFDVQLGIPWRGAGPQWSDANGTAQGSRAYATHTIAAGDNKRARRIDVTALVRRWAEGGEPNVGFLLRESSNAVAQFHAREATSPELRPQLLVETQDGRRRFIEPAADASLDCSTYKGLGTAPTLQFAHGNSLALRFAPRQGSLAAGLKSAELILVRADAGAAAAPVMIGVYALKQPYTLDTTIRADGIARAFAGDRGIDKHPDVLFFDAMEGAAPDRRWRVGQAAPTVVVAADAANGFVPLMGRALRSTIRRGEQLGLDLRYRFREHHGADLDEVYFRYYLRLSASWLAASDGGKLPGLAGTYGRAGWGGRPWDGSAGWSLRGAYSALAPTGAFAEPHVMLSTYAYHAGAPSRYGEGLPWVDGDLGGWVHTDRWVCIEQHVRLNTPGREDGQLEVWVDGRQVLRRTNLRLRDLAGIRIEEVWMNVFHGGTAAAPSDMHAFMDQVVVARRYIGPLAP